MKLKTQIKLAYGIVVMLILLLGVTANRLAEVEHRQKLQEQRLDTYYVLVKELYKQKGGGEAWHTESGKSINQKD